MNAFRLTVAAVVLLAVAGLANAVPPAYEGHLGNPEEPALRPIKWVWHGVTSLVSSTHAGKRAGIEKSPVAAVSEGAKGAAVGTGALVRSTAKGLVHAPLPEKKPRNPISYEEAALRSIEAQTAPCCCCKEECAEAPEAACDAVPEPEPAPSTVLISVSATPAAPLPAQSELTDVQKSQRKYVPVQASYQGSRIQQGRGNLLKLAR